MFINECHANGFACGDGKPITHVLMDGGILSVPFSKIEIFYALCIKHINNFEKIFVVEQKTNFFNFFVDIDYQSGDALSMHEIVEISKIIIDKVATIYKCKCIVSIAEPKPKGEKIKSGIHINWQGLVVDQRNAIRLMHCIVQTLNTVYSYTDWASVIDASVYGSADTNTRGSGFRMPWSHKKGKHDYCNGKGCVVCNGSGKIIESEYLPVFAWDPDGTFIALEDQTPTLAMLVNVTIRTQETSSVIELTEPVTDVLTKKEGNFTKSQTREEFEDRETNILLETYIRQYIAGQANARIQKIFKGTNCYFVKTNSKFCENLGRSHGSNHVWFFINKDAMISQKCFCMCITTEGRRNGLCKNFESRKYQLSKKIKELLFPNKILTNIKKATICSYLL
jgi:hypothetical protein